MTGQSMSYKTAVGVLLPSPEDRKASNLRKVVISIYLEFRTMGQIHKRGDSQRDTT
jgi:hypothetical protein